MRLVVLAVLACAALTSAQLGIVGSKVGSRVGADIGLLTGTMLDTVPSVIAMGAATVPPPPPPRRGPARGGGPRGPFRDQGEWDLDSSYERGRGRPGDRLRGRRPNPNYN